MMELQTMNRLPSGMTMQARPFHAAGAKVMVLRHGANRPESGLWRALPLAIAISGGLWALGAGIAIAALHHL
jgi:hypothetical protein